jgi:hypothetical protein
MSRTQRKNPRRGSKAFDPSCRNHGSCPWCRNGRRHKNIRRCPIHDSKPLDPEFGTVIEDHFWELTP